MKIFDGHIHATNITPTPEKLISNMESAGVWGGCVFSSEPDRANPKGGTTFDQRLNEVMGWSAGYEDRIFPVMWVHPEENDIIKNVQRAVDAGVKAFKMICSDYYVYDDASMKLLSAIAETDKPVFFHTGILWDGKTSSKYNRPINWESLIEIKNLRFSMGHCSWPWHDECIALYGKFLNGYLRNENPSEMFFDLTPGTPLIYRRDLLTKLFTIGYDVPDNIFYGTDSYVGTYGEGGWPQKWIKVDNGIYDELNISDKTRNKIYHDNLLRFLGITKTKIQHKLPDIDNSNETDVNMER